MACAKSRLRASSYRSPSPIDSKTTRLALMNGGFIFVREYANVSNRVIAGKAARKGLKFGATNEDRHPVACHFIGALSEDANCVSEILSSPIARGAQSISGHARCVSDPRVRLVYRQRTGERGFRPSSSHPRPTIPTRIIGSLRCKWNTRAGIRDERDGTFDRGRAKVSGERRFRGSAAARIFPRVAPAGRRGLDTHGRVTLSIDRVS